MLTIEEAKREAKRLHKSPLAQSFGILKLSQAQEIVAAAKGFPNWHALDAYLRGQAVADAAHPTTAAEPPKDNILGAVASRLAWRDHPTYVALETCLRRNPDKLHASNCMHVLTAVFPYVAFKYGDTIEGPEGLHSVLQTMFQSVDSLADFASAHATRLGVRRRKEWAAVFDGLGRREQLHEGLEPHAGTRIIESIRDAISQLPFYMPANR